MHKDDLISTFQINMEYRNLSTNTLKMYSYFVSLFLDYTSVKDCSDYTLQDAINFMIHLKIDNNYEPQSLNVVACAIRYFYDVVLDKPLLKRHFPNIKYHQKDVFIFTIDQINQLLNTNDIRMYTFILLGFDCGLRVSEVVKLRISDIDSKNMLLHIRNSKRNKSRVVTLSNTCLHALRKYYLTYDRPDDYLFPGIKRPHMHPTTLNNMFTQYLKQFDFYTKDIHYHSLRHTFATMTLETGENIFLLKKLLGHSSLSSTSRYIKYDRYDIQKVIPLSQKLGVF